jgi:hypothetical protein
VFPTPYQGRPFVKLLIQPPPVPHHGPVLTPTLGAGGALSGWVLSRGILTDLYDAPPYSTAADFQNVVTAVPVDALSSTGTGGVAYDDTQPFPIRGTVDVWWEAVQPVIK